MFWAIALTGCDVSQWDPGAPEVLEVSSYTLTTTPEQGTNSHRVEEVWVYGAADVLGVYPLPATIALPQGAPQTVTLVPGIRANGVAATRRTYRYYDVNTVSLDGDPTTVESVDFGGGYVDHSGLTTKVILAEDFESANRFVAGAQQQRRSHPSDRAQPSVRRIGFRAHQAGQHTHATQRSHERTILQPAQGP